MTPLRERVAGKRVRALDIAPATVRRYVEERFSLARMVRQYEEIYHAAARQNVEKEIPRQAIA